MTETNGFMIIPKLQVTILVFIFIGIFENSLYAQPFVDLISFKYQHYPSQRFTEKPGSQIINQLDGSFFVPFLQKNKSYLLVGGNYRNIIFKTEKNKNTFYNTGIQVGYDYQWKNNKWRTTTMLLSKLNADEFQIEQRNIQYGGFILFKYKQNEKLQFSCGMYYNRELFGNYFLPLIGINWKAGNRINLFGTLPSYLTMEYRLDSTVYFGLTYNSILSTYRINTNSLNVYFQEGDKKVDHKQIKLFINWNFYKRIIFFAEGGYTYKRQFRIFDENNNPILIENSVFGKTKDGVFVNAGFAYRIRFGKW